MALPFAKAQLKDLLHYDSLENLTRDQLQSLNAAFNSVFRQDAPAPAKRPRLEPTSPPLPVSDTDGGGFLADDVEPAPGGFVVNQASVMPSSALAVPQEPRPKDEQSDAIPLSKITRLLDSLNLPSDGQVLTAFETGAQSEDDDAAPDEQIPRSLGGMVSRRTFLRVCAVLIGNESSDEDSNGHAAQQEDSASGSENSFAPSGSEDSDAPHQSGSGGQRTTRASRRRRGGEELQMLDDGHSEDESGVVQLATRRSKKDKGKSKAVDGNEDGLSDKQRQKAADLFTAFLPEDDKAQSNKNWQGLVGRSLGMQEIRQVATLVKISLTDAEARSFHCAVEANDNLRRESTDQRDA